MAVALDGTRAAEAVLAYAFAEAERHQSPVAALPVIWRGETAQAAADHVRNLEEILAAAKELHPNLIVSVTLVGDDVAEAVRNASGGVRLMVMGRSHPTSWGGWWRKSVARAVLGNARCPLVIVA